MTDFRFLCSFAATVGAFGMTLSSTNRLKRKSGDGLKTGLVFCGVIPTSGTIRRFLELPDGNRSARDTGNANPKTAPILEAVGKVESPEDAERFYSHTLIQTRSSGCGIFSLYSPLVQPEPVQHRGPDDPSRAQCGRAGPASEPS